MYDDDYTKRTTTVGKVHDYVEVRSTFNTNDKLYILKCLKVKSKNINGSFTNIPIEKNYSYSFLLHFNAKTSQPLKAKIVDRDGHVVELGVSGELWTRGYMVMKGYWQDEKKTKETMHDTWYKTG